MSGFYAFVITYALAAQQHTEEAPSFGRAFGCARVFGRDRRATDAGTGVQTVAADADAHFAAELDGSADSKCLHDYTLTPLTV